MKLWGIFRFELAYQLRRVWPWLFFAVVLYLSFLMGRDTSLSDAMYEDFFANSAFAIAKSTVIGGLVWLLIAAPVAGEAAARDVATGMHPLIYTAPISKAEYLGGRFLAALTLNALILVAVQVGILISIYLPGTNASVIGPFRPAAFLSVYAFISLPNAIVATAIQFAMALRTGRATMSYVASVLLVFTGFFFASFLNFFVRQGLGSLVDPIGINFIIEDLAHEWTTIERNTRLITLEGTILWNRLLLLGVAVVALTLAYRHFHFAHRVQGAAWWRRRRHRDAHSPMPATIVAASEPIDVPQMPRTFGMRLQMRQTLAIAWDSFRTIATSKVGLALLTGVPLLTVLIVFTQMESLGTPLVPRTARVVSELTAPLSAELSRWVIIPLVVVFFAGELVWKERDGGVSEITDTMPGSEWAPLLGKFLGLALLLVAFMSLLMAAGMAAQLILHYQNFQITLYLKMLFGLQLPEYFLFAVLALVVHVLANQKYIGHLVAIIAYMFIVLATTLGVEHNLLVYGAGPRWSYTEMRGFAGSVGPWVWFKLYWAAWAIMLAVVAKLLWVRGKEGGLRARLRLARTRFTRVAAMTSAVAIALVVSLGGFIFYNTNVLNEYHSSSAIKDRQAEYERQYGRYANIAQPKLTGTKLRVEIYPERRAVGISGSYRLMNRSALPIDSIHVTTALGGIKTGAVTFDRSSKVAVDDEEHGYRIYALEKPLAPGDTLRLDFEVSFEQQGFGNHGRSPAVDAGGSYFTAAMWFPFVGYQPRRALIAASERRAYGLPPRPVVASLYDDEANDATALREGIAFDAVVGTAGDQVAVTDGALRRTWTEGGRSYFHYSTDAPIGDEWTFFSAHYAVREERWKDIDIRILHDPEHTAHLDRMMRSTRASLDYYTQQFGPYPFHHLTFVEHPAGAGMGAHADAGMISYGQGMAFWVPKDEPRKLDMLYAVWTHEMAHQWTVPAAIKEGVGFLVEGLAWYSGMLVVRESRGDEQLRQLTTFMRYPYPHPPIRRGEPLLRALDPYLSYRRGPFAMYALSEYIGADRVNGVLRQLIARNDSVGALPVTTLDLYRGLKAVTPDSTQYLLHDLLAVNTFWEFKTNRVRAVESTGGAWQVTMDVRARKIVYDSAGVKTEVPMDEWIPIGIFGEAEQGHDDLSAPLYMRMHRIRSGEQTITVTVPRKPVRAGIDPYHLLDWEQPEADDNILRVKS
jgi:ABC-type transport system involved in multi-copper enzyme maturation permease subunit